MLKQIKHFIPSDETGEYICLETGEVLSRGEYHEWVAAMKEEQPTTGTGLKNLRPSLQDGFQSAVEELQLLAFMLEQPDFPIISDVNENVEVGETGVTPLTFGSVEHTVHPIFSELQAWAKSPDLADFVRHLSWVIELIGAKILKGDKVPRAKLESLTTWASMAVTSITPLRDPPSLNPNFLIMANAAIHAQNSHLKTSYSQTWRKLQYTLFHEEELRETLGEYSTELLAKNQEILRLSDALTRRNRLIKTLRSHRR
jgi:hypothetical protein